MPKLSILIPAYIDHADKLPWLRECLQSVRNQTITDWEALIIDDASPMLLGEIKAEFADDSRFRWFHAATNQGPAKCRNTAAALAESEALFALDSDDLAGEPDAFAKMLDAWLQDPMKIIYGNLQRLTASGGEWHKGKVIVLAEYSFDWVLDLQGIMPVSALHSKECHLAAGGWKPDLGAGLEDIEYWIAAGKAGFCGQRINVVNLVYRKHETSRSYNLRYVNRREDEMGSKIKEIHSDVYAGRYPMACCGGGRTVGNPPKNGNGGGQAQAQMQMISAPLSTTLENVPANEKVWVEYRGLRTASFPVRGPMTNITYTIQGTGHRFECHINDVPKFQSAARGRDYAVGVPAPGEATQPDVKVVEIQVPEFATPSPALATIERLDPIAAAARDKMLPGQVGFFVPFPPPSPVAPSPPLPTLPIPPISRSIFDPTPTITAIPTPQIVPSDQRPGQSLTAVAPGATDFVISQTWDLSVLQLRPEIKTMLEAESWSIERLAAATEAELMAYKGIGQARAQTIIGVAKGFLSK